MKKIIEELESYVDAMKPSDEVSFDLGEGVLISVNDARKICEFYRTHVARDYDEHGGVSGHKFIRYTNNFWY